MTDTRPTNCQPHNQLQGADTAEMIRQYVQSEVRLQLVLLNQICNMPAEAFIDHIQKINSARDAAFENMKSALVPKNQKEFEPDTPCVVTGESCEYRSSAYGEMKCKRCGREHCI